MGIMIISDVFSKYTIPQKDDFFTIITKAIHVLKNENTVLRPLDETGSPGGFLDIATFNGSIPVVLIPDLHARLDFFNEILNFPFCFAGECSGELTVKEALRNGKVFVVCVGDGLHSEKRGYGRWLLSQEEWLKGNTLNNHMCKEMEEGLELMSCVMQLKAECPDYFHFLKGNHENILNSYVGGNLPFRKFAAEGEMVKDFMISVYGSKITQAYADFENNLPLFAKGTNFLVSHAEPRRAFSSNELINAHCDEDTIIGLTWTRNEEADENAVKTMLDHLLPYNDSAIYFAGHRTVSGTHKSLRNGKFMQIHNPNEHYIIIINQKKKFNPLSDIYNTKTGKIAGSNLENVF